MKVFLCLTLFGALALADDSFEIEKGGRTYVCSPKSNEPTGSVSRLCQLAKTGNGQTIYYQSGKVFTYSAGRKGATWYYENGKVITYGAANPGSTWYYSNGKVLTHSAGKRGATWYYENGNVITHSAGVKGATWYYKNGSVMTYNGPELSEDELLFPCDYIE